MPAHLLSGTVSEPAPLAGDMATFELPTWLLSIIRGLCAQGDKLPTPWNHLAGFLCGILPPPATSGELTQAVSLPSWLIALLRLACRGGALLPAPWNFLAALVCGTVSKAESPCGCK